MANVGVRTGVAMPMRGLSWQDETAEDNHPNRDKDDRYGGRDKDERHSGAVANGSAKCLRHFEASSNLGVPLRANYSTGGRWQVCGRDNCGW